MDDDNVIEITVRAKRAPEYLKQEMSTLQEDLNSGPKIREAVVIQGDAPGEMIVITVKGITEILVRGMLTHSGYWDVNPKKGGN